MSIAKPFSGIAHRRDTSSVKFNRIKATNLLKFNRQPHIITDFLPVHPQLAFHLRDRINIRRAEIDSENHFTGDHIARIGKHINMARRAHRMRFM